MGRKLTKVGTGFEHIHINHDVIKKTKQVKVCNFFL
jgi:hypothetical protein